MMAEMPSASLVRPIVGSGIKAYMVTMTSESHSFTYFGSFVCFWVLVSSFQYGFHISVLNQLQSTLTCLDTDGVVHIAYGLPTCIPMTDAQFSLVTASFTIGGLFGSLIANIISDKYGRSASTSLNAVLNIVGAGLMTVASSMNQLLIGRTLTGVAAGLGVCVGPVYIGEIAPSKIKGSIGILTQMSIVLGILITQSMGLYFATPHQWRFVLFFSSALSLFQFITSAFTVESPAWLTGNGKFPQARLVSHKLWGAADHAVRSRTPIEASENPSEPLLTDESEADERLAAMSRPSAMSVPQLLKAPELRKSVLVVSFIMMAQQFSGINAVLYYSNAILSSSIPDAAPFVSLGITVMNCLMTFPPIFLIDTMGRKALLSLSTAGSFITLILLGLGLDYALSIMAFIAIIAYIASFAVGLGPVPYVVISDIAPFNAVSALSSVALSVNWIGNFIVGLVFLPLRNLLASGDPLKEGRVFYVFAAALALLYFIFMRIYKEGNNL